ncbi:MAG TPA: hypothetical protein VMT19_03700 [Thermoanaerobaculaceae bacterium]|nr:hypothetical protein [Thermoanaerobaculaceae bacterium]
MVSATRGRRSPRPGVRGPIVVFAPARVDLAGGTLDLWPIYCLHPGSTTVNAALRMGVKVRLTPGGAPAGCIRHVAPSAPPLTLTRADAGRHLTAAVGFHVVPEGGFAVEVLDQPPVGSGLGASSAFAVALGRACLALVGRRIPPPRFVSLLRDLEARVLGVPTGVQDYVAASTGGVLAIHLEPGGERVERLAVATGWVARRLVVVFSGVTHASGMVNWDVYRARIDGDASVVRALDAIAGAASACRAALLAADEARVGHAIAEEWAARRTLAPSVSNRALDAILNAGVRAGAMAGKACGAGGGGSVIFWTRPDLAASVAREALAAAPAGAFEVTGGLTTRGATVRSGRATM